MIKEYNKHIPPTLRLLNRDGTFNIERRRKKIIITNDVYHSLLSASWPTFLGYVVTLYLSINIIFGTAYWFVGAHGLDGMSYSSESEHWLECFFFSVQTVATIGYGKLTPHGLFTNLLVTIEALIGMFSIALQTGLVFSRFSKPTAKVVFSDYAVINQHDRQRSLVIRLANARLNQIVEATAHVVLLKSETTAEGETYRNIYDLKLERDNSPAFALSWTIVHPIDKESPLFSMSLEEMIETNVEIFVNITGVDETFAQNVYSRFSYTPKEIVFDHRFADMLKRNSDGRVSIDIDKINHIEPLV